MSSRKITVLLPIYKEELGVVIATLESISEQTILPDKIIIVDDCPGCRSEEDVHRIERCVKNSEILYVLNGDNLGLAGALNRVLPMVDTEFFARVDCGDIQKPNRFEKQLEYIDNNPELDLVGCQVSVVGCNKVSAFCSTEFGAYLVSFFATAVAHPTYFGRAKVLQDIMYPNIRLAQDFGFIKSLRKSGYRFCSIPISLVDYHDTSLGNREYKLKQSAAFALQALGMEDIEIVANLVNKKGYVFGIVEKFVGLYPLYVISLFLKVMARIVYFSVKVALHDK